MSITKGLGLALEGLLDLAKLEQPETAADSIQKTGEKLQESILGVAETLEKAKKKKPKADEDDKGDGNDEDEGDPEESDDEEDDCDKAAEEDDLAKKSIAIITKSIRDNSGDGFSTIIKECGFPHAYHAASDTFELHYGAQFRSPHDQNSAELLGLTKAAFGSKVGNGPNFLPTDEEMEKILSLAGSVYPKEAFKVYYATAADQNVDRHFEHFHTKALESMAVLSYDQPFMMDHNHYRSEGVVGKIFDAKVTSSKGQGKRLVLKTYMLNKPLFEPIMDGIESGINNKVSVGVRLRRKDYTCDVCKKPMFVNKNGGYDFCGHLPGMDLDSGPVTATIQDIIDFLEFSRVTAPAQREVGFKNYNAELAHKRLIKSFQLSDSLAGALAKTQGS